MSNTTKNKRKIRANIIKNVIPFAILFLVVFSFLQGCARGGSGGGIGEKQITFQVTCAGDVDNNDGNYFIAMRTGSDSAFAPGDEVDDWQDGDYFVLWDFFNDFSLYEIIDSDSEEISVFLTSDIDNQQFSVTFPLSEIGDPNIIYCNVVTTDILNETLDSLDDSLTINTNSVMPETVSDLEGDQVEAPFDIVEVTATVYTP